MTIEAMAWRPVSEYTAESGRAVVWLEWLHYSGQQMGHSGQFMIAYRMSVGEGSVWVEEGNSIPIETTGRRVTHFLIPGAP